MHKLANKYESQKQKGSLSTMKTVRYFFVDRVICL